MTREEERIKQIEQFASQCYEDGERYSAFISGAIWADEHPVNVWHNASEEPLLEEMEIISINEQGFAYISERFGSTFSYDIEDYSWQSYINLLKIRKWAYVKDLFPKGGEQ